MYTAFPEHNSQSLTCMKWRITLHTRTTRINLANANLMAHFSLFTEGGGCPEIQFKH